MYYFPREGDYLPNQNRKANAHSDEAIAYRGLLVVWEMAGHSWTLRDSGKRPLE